MTGRTSILALLAIWLLTTGSSCSATVNSGRTTIAASDAAAAAGIGVTLVGIGIYCMVNTEECFPDEEALQAQADAYERARATYTAGLRRHRNGDPAGLEWICQSAHQGYARAQFFYGSHLYRQGPQYEDESVGWLWRAAAQGHAEAGMMLRQLTGLTPPVGSRPSNGTATEAPPVIGGCEKLIGGPQSEPTIPSPGAGAAIVGAVEIGLTRTGIGGSRVV